MGILIRIGSLKIGSSRGGGVPAALKAKFLFWGKVSEIVGGQMPNKQDAGVTYLTITGTGLNARYQTPDAGAYRSADTDNCWWKTDASESTCDGNRLIAYDFSRTLVKYDNTSPYTIREIIILKAGETLTTAEMNFMRDYMDLSTWWNDTLSLYGNLKGNRAGEQSHWTAELIGDADALAYIARMTTPPSAALVALISDLFVDLKAADVYSELDQYVLMNLHDAQASKLDLKTDTLNHVWVGSPTWTAKLGVTIDTDKYVNSKFITDAGTKFILDNCGIVFTKSGVTGSYYEGVYDNHVGGIEMITITNNGIGLHRINQDSGVTFTKQITEGFNFFARISNTQVTVRTNNTEETLNANSYGIPGHEYFIGSCDNWNFLPGQVAENFCIGSVYAQYGFCSKLDATKRAAFQAIIDQFNIDIQTAF